MRVLILADASFASREQSMLSRLGVGLTGEGVRVVVAVPEEQVSGIPEALFAAIVGYESGGGRLTRRGRTKRMLDAVAAALEAGAVTDDPWLDVVHCFGFPACEIGAEAARVTGAGLAVEVWSAGAVERARRLTVERAGREGEPPLAFFAAGEPIAAALRAGRSPGEPGVVDPVETARWGVHVPAAPHRPVGDGDAVSIAVLVDGGDDRAVLAALTALGDVARRRPELLIFFDADVAEEAGRARAVWKRAKELRILDRLSMVGGMEGRREPILHVDLLIQPEAAGAHHSLTLEAMAGGTVVIAREDPLVASLIDGRTAVLVRNGAADAWAEAIEGVLGDAARAAGLRESARAFIREQHPAAGHVGAVLRGYERLAAMRSVR